MSPSHLYVLARPDKPTYCRWHSRQLCYYLKMCWTQVTLVIVAPQAFKNGIEVLTPIVIAHAKDHSDVDQMLTRNQIMEYASKDNYDDLCVDSAHIDSLLPLLQGMHYWTTSLHMIKVLPGDVFTNGNHNLPWCDIHSCQMNCATLGIRIAKFLLVHWVTKEVHPIVCLSARVVSFKLPGVSMSHWTSDLVTLCSWFSRQGMNIASQYAWKVLTLVDWLTVYDNRTIHDFAVVSLMWLWLPRQLKTPQQVIRGAWQNETCQSLIGNEEISVSHVLRIRPSHHLGYALIQALIRYLLATQNHIVL